MPYLPCFQGPPEGEEILALPSRGQGFLRLECHAVN
jgi:hypothetical protein